jgi:DNA-binding beta-propeller fold protein YncE
MKSLYDLAKAPGRWDNEGGIAALNEPFYLAVEHSGNVWVSNSGGDTVIKLAPDCRLLAAFGLPGTQSAGMFKRPLGLAVDRRGNVCGGGLNTLWGLG